ncbi:MAG: spore cortex biosynthesis protein YabQ [Oscillospiraceae bacterium]|nr:spore cortex biosynthesis protein YabQ [Clostridia bacterium]MBQ9857932.1 spore cortex biosynthesis protein YabQ [Oscillospiraceae bacterium]
MNQAAISAALSVLVGIFLGAFYDIIRFARVLLGVNVSCPFKKGKLSLHAILGYVFVSISDFLFFVVAAAVMCIFFFLTGDGRMRGYALVGALLGFLLYYNTIGRLFISAVTYMVALLKKLIRLILVPFVHLGRFFKKLCLRIFNMPIVNAQIKRYNDYISKRKKKAVARSRRKKAKKGGYVSNGGAHG